MLIPVCAHSKPQAILISGLITLGLVAHVRAYATATAVAVGVEGVCGSIGMYDLNTSRHRKFGSQGADDESTLPRHGLRRPIRVAEPWIVNFRWKRRYLSAHLGATRT